MFNFRQQLYLFSFFSHLVTFKLVCLPKNRLLFFNFVQFWTKCLFVVTVRSLKSFVQQNCSSKKKVLVWRVRGPGWIRTGKVCKKMCTYNIQIAFHGKTKINASSRQKFSIVFLLVLKKNVFNFSGLSNSFVHFSLIFLKDNIFHETFRSYWNMSFVNEKYVHLYT